MLITRIIKEGTPLYLKINKKIHFLDRLFLMRPPLFFPVWTMVMAGLCSASVLSTPELYWTWDYSWSTIYLFLGVTMITGASFIRYQIENKESDEINQKIVVLNKVNLSAEKLRILIRWSTIIGLVIIFITLCFVAFRKQNLFYLLGVIWGIFIHLFWSTLFYHRKYHWSKLPILGIIGHGFSGFSLFMLGWSYTSSNLGMGLLFSIPYLLAFIGVSLVTTIPDIEGDKQVGKNTFAVRYGIRSTIAWGTLSVFFSVIIGYWLKDSVISTASIISLPFFLIALIFLRIDHVLRAIRYPILILAVFISVRYPWFFVFLFITYYFFKNYYYFRFEKDWPTFQVSYDKD